MSSVDARPTARTGARRAILPAPGSLARRLMLWQIGTSFLIVTVAAVVLQFATVAEINWIDDQVLERRMHTIRTLLQGDGPTQLIIAHEVVEDIDWPRRISIRVVGPDGAVLHETPGMSQVLPVAMFAPLENDVLDHIARSTIRSSFAERYRALVVRVPILLADGAKGEAVIQIATDTTLDGIVLARFQRNLAFVIGLGLLACAFIGWQVVRGALRPLNSITEAAKRVGVRTLATRIPATGLPEELSELALRFNEMLARLEIAYAGLRQYADNVAHELRTPINKMLLESEIALMSPRSPEEYREALLHYSEECTQLSTLVERLLFLARTDNGQTALAPQEVDLAQEARAIRDYYEGSAADAGVRLALEAPQPARALVDRTLFQRAIGNLIANAIAHTPRGGCVSLSVLRAGQDVRVRVSDTGEGIAPQHLQHVFDRFYRCDDARTNPSGRLGLGLAITKSIVELHGGAIELESALGDGATVTIVLPCERVGPLTAPEPVPA